MVPGGYRPRKRSERKVLGWIESGQCTVIDRWTGALDYLSLKPDVECQTKSVESGSEV